MRPKYPADPCMLSVEELLATFVGGDGELT